MPWAHLELLSGGPDLLRARAATADRIVQHVLKAYTPGDSFATAAGNSCGGISLVPGDIVTAAAGSDALTTLAAQDILLDADSGVAPDVWIALIDEVSNLVLYATQEVNDQQLYDGNTFECPAFTYRVNQPT